MRSVAWWLGWCLVSCGGRSDLLPPGDGAGAPDGATADEGATAPVTTGIEYPTCGPTDGAAFGLRIASQPLECTESTSPPAEFDEIDAWMPLPTRTTDLLITEANGHGAACSFTPSGTLCRIAASTRLHIESVSVGTVQGEYTMRFADGTSKAASFVAAQRSYVATCG